MPSVPAPQPRLLEVGPLTEGERRAMRASHLQAQGELFELEPTSEQAATCPACGATTVERCSCASTGADALHLF